MSQFRNRILMILSKDGKRFKTQLIPNIYLDTEQEWIKKQFFFNDHLDGVAFIIDWDTQEVILVRHA